jgi:hypothetical protein
MAPSIPIYCAGGTELLVEKEEMGTRWNRRKRL